MKTKNNTAMSLTASLEAVRAAAKAHSTQLAAPAAPPAPAAPAQAPKAEPKQYNVRLTPEARARLRSAAALCQMSDQDFIEKWAMTLPAPAPAPAMPWESTN